MSPDPVARAAFTMANSLLAFLVEEGILTKDQAQKFIANMVKAMKQTAGPDEDAIALLSQVQKFVTTLKEPTKN